jgi:hypothetical protein
MGDGVTPPWAEFDRSRGRILLVTTVEVTVRSFLLPLALRLRTDGWEVHAMAAGITDASGPYSDLDGIGEAPWSRSATDVHGLLRGRAEVRKVVLRLGIDVAQVHTPVAAFVTRVALRRLCRSGRVRVIYTAHGFPLLAQRAAAADRWETSTRSQTASAPCARTQTCVGAWPRAARATALLYDEAKTLPAHLAVIERCAP